MGRPADAHDFEDKVIEATEHREGAVVYKDARVVEEVWLNRTEDFRVETVRKTEVAQDWLRRA